MGSFFYFCSVCDVSICKEDYEDNMGMCNHCYLVNLRKANKLKGTLGDGINSNDVDTLYKILPDVAYREHNE